MVVPSCPLRGGASGAASLTPGARIPASPAPLGRRGIDDHGPVLEHLVIPGRVGAEGGQVEFLAGPQVDQDIPHVLVRDGLRRRAAARMAEYFLRLDQRLAPRGGQGARMR